MAKSVEVYPLLSKEQSAERQVEIAKGVKRFVYESTRRVDASDAEARSVADPNDEDQVREQLHRMLHPPVEGTQYLGIYADEEWRGVAKLGPWLYGDEGHYGKGRKLATRIRQLGRPLETLPAGLHVMAVNEDLTQTALEAIYFNYVPDRKPLKASVHENDQELQDAFTAIGAPMEGPRASIKLGNYVANYVLRVLPRRE